MADLAAQYAARTWDQQSYSLSLTLSLFSPVYGYLQHPGNPAEPAILETLITFPRNPCSSSPCWRNLVTANLVAMNVPVESTPLKKEYAFSHAHCAMDNLQALVPLRSGHFMEGDIHNPRSGIIDKS